MKRIVLIDGNSLLYKTYFATAYGSGDIMRSLDGTPTNAVFGFINVIHKIVESEPDYVFVAFDAGKKTFRHLEYGEYKGLGLIPGEIVRFKPEDMILSNGESLKVPHMGWNTLEIVKPEPLFKGIEDQSSVYFVHSYYLETQADVVSCYTDYGTRIAVAAQKDHVFATQFHPEKSGPVGLKILENFGGI